jgi:hypothetical protein
MMDELWHAICELQSGDRNLMMSTSCQGELTSRTGASRAVQSLLQVWKLLGARLEAHAGYR